MRLNKKIFHPKHKDHINHHNNNNDLLSYHFQEQSKIQQRMNASMTNTNQDDPYLRVKANGAIVMNRSRSYTSLSDHWLIDNDDDDQLLHDSHHNTFTSFKKKPTATAKKSRYSSIDEQELELEEEEYDVDDDDISFSSTISSSSRPHPSSSSPTQKHSSSSPPTSYLPQFDSFLTSSPIRLRPSLSTLPPSLSSQASSFSSTISSSTNNNNNNNNNNDGDDNDDHLVPPLPPKDNPLESHHMYRSSSLPTQPPTLPSYHLSYERKLDILLQEMDSVQQENNSIMEKYQLLLDQYNILKSQLVDKDKCVQSLQLQLQSLS
ncbi:hypothetical protein BJ944DRAFT_262882 [Cunninghamella echinulata]|nr:hypothetical protein BJ944DRAFT_262882 [Cunninghamella echinulata]